MGGADPAGVLAGTLLVATAGVVDGAGFEGDVLASVVGLVVGEVGLDEEVVATDVVVVDPRIAPPEIALMHSLAVIRPSLLRSNLLKSLTTESFQAAENSAIVTCPSALVSLRANHSGNPFGSRSATLRWR